jgi:hypothetical protein
MEINYKRLVKIKRSSKIIFFFQIDQGQILLIIITILKIKKMILLLYMEKMKNKKKF